MGVPVEGGSLRDELVGSDKLNQSFYQRHAKSAFDRIFGAILLLLSLPILLVAAVLVRTRLGNPILYRQQRIGRDGAPFELFKLRTMVSDRRSADTPFQGEERRKLHKSADDPRVEPTGKMLRAWRLDELPQFWNVVNGDMSLVGPRPEMPQIVAGYESWQHERHNVKPGVTGLWQVSERNGHLMHECTELDLQYLESISFGNDFKILMKTPGVMIGSRRGY